MKKPEITPLAVLNAHNPLLREGRGMAKNHRPKILLQLIKKGLNWPDLKDMYRNGKDGNDNRRYIVEGREPRDSSGLAKKLLEKLIFCSIRNYLQ